MRVSDALRWSLYDRAIAVGSFLVGAALIAGSVWIGAGDYLNELLLGDPSSAGEPSSPAIAIAGSLVGVLIWHTGRVTARNYAIVSATESQVHEHLDHDRLATVAVSKIDDRISQLESDVEEVRRQAARVEQSMRADDFTVEELESGPSTSGQLDATRSSATGHGAGDDGVGAASTAASGPAGTADDAGPGSASDDGTGVGSAGTDPTASGREAATPDDADEADPTTGSGANDAGTTNDAETDDAADKDGRAADGANADEDDEQTGGDESADEDDEPTDVDDFEWEGDDDEYFRNS